MIADSNAVFLGLRMRSYTSPARLWSLHVYDRIAHPIDWGECEYFGALQRRVACASSTPSSVSARVPRTGYLKIRSRVGLQIFRQRIGNPEAGLGGQSQMHAHRLDRRGLGQGRSRHLTAMDGGNAGDCQEQSLPASRGIRTSLYSKAMRRISAPQLGHASGRHS
jgi:hypothetical protein